MEFLETAGSALFVVALVLGAILGGLRLAAAWGESTRDHGDPSEPPPWFDGSAPTSLPPPRAIDEEERAAECLAAMYDAELAAALEPLDRIADATLRLLDRSFEKFLRDLNIPPADQRWARVVSGEYAIVGAS